MDNNDKVDNNLSLLTKEEAIEALKNGEYLVNGKDSYGVAHYHWYMNSILKSDSYYDLSGEGDTIPENELPLLYRMGEGSFGNLTDSIKSKVKIIFSYNKYPLLLQKLGIDKTTEKLLSIIIESKQQITSKTIERLMSDLEKQSFTQP